MFLTCEATNLRIFYTEYQLKQFCNDQEHHPDLAETQKKQMCMKRGH